MSTPSANALTFNFGFHRRLLTAMRLTPPTGNTPCPMCGGPTQGGTVTYAGQPTGDITATIHCKKRQCFTVVQRIDRTPQVDHHPGNG